jgi:hypothetical protein
MRTIPLMSGVPHFPDIIILGTTHPAPFVPTTHRSRWTFNMITPIHLLNPSPAETRFRITPQPGPGLWIRSKLLSTEMIQVFGTADVGMCGRATAETGFEVTGRTSKMRREF